MQLSLDENEISQMNDRGDQVVTNQEIIREHFDQEWKLLEDFAQNISTVCRRRIDEVNEYTKWTSIRPRTSWDFIDYGNIDPVLPLFEEENLDKENQLVEDLLNCFLGFHGRFITAESIDGRDGERTFKISDKVSGACRSMALRLLPLAGHYSRVVRYVQNCLDLTAGRVNQALAGYLRDKVMRFTELIVKLDAQHSATPLNMNHIYFTLQKTMCSMKIFNDLVFTVKDLKGGRTLSALHSFINMRMVDALAQRIAIEAAVAASEPYFQSVSTWIYKGVLYDPYDEFMIIQRGGGQDSSNWDNIFNIRETEIPVFLKKYQIQIFKAGKYLDAVRKSMDMNDSMPCCVEETLSYNVCDETYSGSIKRAYHFANTTLKDIMKRHQLYDRIKTAKSFLCLEGGDLFHNIIDNCWEELHRPAHEVCVSYLPILIRSSVETSSLSSLQHADQMVLYLEKETLKWQVFNLHSYGDKENDYHEEQTGLEALTFKVEANWPISLVLHQMAIKCYQMLFRHLFYLKWIHFKLVRANRINSRANTIKQHYIKHLMTVFVQNCLSYMTSGTIEVHWLHFQAEFNESTTIEELRQSHDNMLYKCLQGCMLASPNLFQKLRTVLKICLKFASNMSEQYENKFFTAVSSLFYTAVKEGPTSGLENFIEEITRIFQNEPPITLSQ